MKFIFDKAAANNRTQDAQNAPAPPDDVQENFLCACQEGNAHAIDESLRLYPSLINAADDCGWTPLHHAAMWAQTETAELLLRRGARADVTDNTGLRADEQASRMSYEPIATLIRNALQQQNKDKARHLTKERQAQFQDGLQADIAVRSAPLRLKK